MLYILAVFCFSINFFRGILHLCLCICFRVRRFCIVRFWFFCHVWKTARPAHVPVVIRLEEASSHDRSFTFSSLSGWWELGLLLFDHPLFVILIPWGPCPCSFVTCLLFLTLHMSRQLLIFLVLLSCLWSAYRFLRFLYFVSNRYVSFASCAARSVLLLLRSSFLTVVQHGLQLYSLSSLLPRPPLFRSQQGGLEVPSFSR